MAIKNAAKRSTRSSRKKKSPATTAYLSIKKIHNGIIVTEEVRSSDYEEVSIKEHFMPVSSPLAAHEALTHSLESLLKKLK